MWRARCRIKAMELIYGLEASERESAGLTEDWIPSMRVGGI